MQITNAESNLIKGVNIQNKKINVATKYNWLFHNATMPENKLAELSSDKICIDINGKNVAGINNSKPDALTAMVRLSESTLQLTTV